MSMMKNTTVIYVQMIRSLCIQLLQEMDTDNINRIQKTARIVLLETNCTKSKNMTKVIERHLWEEFREYADEIRHTMEWKEIYPQRKETIERIFADCKENNGPRFTRLKGLKKNQQNAWLIFACHNLKKMSLWRGKNRRKPSKSSIYPSKYTKKQFHFENCLYTIKSLCPYEKV